MMAVNTSKIPPPIAKASHIVKPAEPTPDHDLYLPGCDQIADVIHVPTVYFYHPTNTALSEEIQILKESLSKALVIFYPIAGRLRWAEKGGRVELHCNGEGVLVVEAESEATVEDYGSFNFIPRPEMRALIPAVNMVATPINEVPLLVCQVTKFGCGGICIGMGVSHIIGDGQSVLHFVSEWAKIARGESEASITKPYLDRSVLQHVEASLAKPIFEHPEFETPPTLLVGSSDNRQTDVAVLKVTKEQIEKLKNRANEDKAADDARGFSRYECLSAHIWRCACKARGLVSEQPTKLYIPADIRHRLQPPLPEKYFGNTIVRAAAFAKVGDLLSRPLSYAASRVRETTQSLTDEYIRSYLAFVKNVDDVSRYRDAHTAFYDNPNLKCTSWAGLPLYGVDFGWGKEIHMGLAALGSDGKFLIPTTSDGDGSFNVYLRLQVEHVDAFTKFFDADM